MFREMLNIPNLLSLSRIFLAPVIGYYLWRGDARSTLICLILLAIAGITDGLDGYLARRLNQVSNFGIALDPVADKILAGAVVVMLIFYRDFPLWLAVLIIGRDVLILLAGMYLVKERRLVLPSSITGKYAFAAIAFLLGSYIIRFDFGILLTTYVTIGLLVASTINYARVFMRVRNGRDMPVFRDRPVYKALRVGASIVGLVIFFYKLLSDLT